MRAIDPIFVTPRLVERDWGRTDLGEWLGRRGQMEIPVAEAWALDPANATCSGPLGRGISRQPYGVLGDRGRAPPRVRLVFPTQAMDVKSTSPVSFWTILEPGVASLPGSLGVSHKPGERIRAYEGAAVGLAAGSVALEVSSSFLPTNDAGQDPQLIRLPPVSARTRATLFRDTGLSVETWSVPEWSRIVPDGETCHVLVALGSEIRVDGRALRAGESVLVPAWGRPIDIVAERRGAKLLVAYPDALPTAVWHHAPGPDPTAGQLPKPEPAQPPVLAAAATLQSAMAAFHVEQCDGLPTDPVAKPLPGRSEVLPVAEAVIAATGADIRIGGDMAFYPGCYPKADIKAVEYTTSKANTGGTVQLWGALGTCVVVLPWCFAKGATAPDQ